MASKSSRIDKTSKSSNKDKTKSGKISRDIASGSSRKVMKAKKKARTQAEISSPSASDTDDSMDDAPAVPQTTVKAGSETTHNSKATSQASDNDSLSDPPETATSPSAASKPNPETSEQAAQEAFTAHYMSQVATEFAEDLDKIRTARDFKGEASLEILLDALRKGTGGFSALERGRMGREILAGS